MKGRDESFRLDGSLTFAMNRGGHRFDLAWSISEICVHREFAPTSPDVEVPLRDRGTTLSPEIAEGAALHFDAICGPVDEFHIRLNAIGQRTELGLLQRPI
jgi:hypothetical protein